MAKNLLDEAFYEWHRHYHHKDLDEKVKPFLNLHQFQDWLKTVRKALMLSTHSIAKKLNISTSAYSRMERAEENGSLSVKNLAKIAEALDCELVYAIRPKKKTPMFALMVWKTLANKVREHHNYREDSNDSSASRYYAFLARLFAERPKVRRSVGWSMRKGYKGYRY